MSRVGNKPIVVPEDVNVTIAGNKVTVKGPKGTLTRDFDPRLKISMQDNVIVVARNSEHRQQRALHGTTRSLIANMVEGVSKGFSKTLELVGVGYRVKQNGKGITLNVGYSHPVEVTPIEGIEYRVDDATHVTVSGIDKELVGAEAARIRSVREPEPYLGKGIRYQGERIITKEGKAGKK